MAIRRQITCINKLDRNNPYEPILKIGGIENGMRWTMTEKDAIAAIDNGIYSFFVYRGGSEAKVIVDTRNGRRYLKTAADDETTNNLLSLPECL
jgi:hypothetical protein